MEVWFRLTLDAVDELIGIGVAQPGVRIARAQVAVLEVPHMELAKVEHGHTHVRWTC